RRDLVRSEVRWRLPSAYSVLESFQDQFRAWIRGCGLSGFQSQQTCLAVRELCANAMEWGHRYERERAVSVAARLDEEKVSVLVRDGGPGFNPRELRHAARPGDPISHLAVRAAANLREGGFGILMASGLVDHLAYNDAGNEALAIKFLPQGSAVTQPDARVAARRA
ncbi:MAG: ATP-binding protein, partial [Gemmataceae bacterium]